MNYSIGSQYIGDNDIGSRSICFTLHFWSSDLKKIKVNGKKLKINMEDQTLNLTDIELKDGRMDVQMNVKFRSK